MEKFSITEKALDELIGAAVVNVAPAEKPTFKVDKNVGEGNPSQPEVNYRQDLLDSLKKLYQNTSKTLNKSIPNNEKIEEINSAIDDYIKEAQEKAVNHVKTIFNDNLQNGKDAIKKLKLPLKDDFNSDTVLDALIDFQKFAIQKNAEQIRNNLINNIYMNSYVGVAYGGQEKATR